MVIDFADLVLCRRGFEESVLRAHRMTRLGVRAQQAITEAVTEKKAELAQSLAAGRPASLWRSGTGSQEI